MKLRWWYYYAIHWRLVKWFTPTFMLRFLIEILVPLTKIVKFLVVVFVSKLKFSFSFRFVDENCQIFAVVIIFVTKINLFSSTKISVFVVVDERNTERNQAPPYHWWCYNVCLLWNFFTYEVWRTVSKISSGMICQNETIHCSVVGSQKWQRFEITANNEIFAGFWSYRTFVTLKRFCMQRCSTISSWKSNYSQFLLALFHCFLLEFNEIWSYCGKIYWQLLL